MESPAGVAAHAATPTIAAIYLKRFKRGPMDPVLFAELIPARGLLGNANQGGKRQVTLLSEESWLAALAALPTPHPPTLPPSTRRANLLLRGLDLAHTRGKLLHLGPAVIRIYNELRPCERMDEAHPGLRAALSPDWRGGAYGEVLEGGVIKVGDEIHWE